MSTPCVIKVEGFNVAQVYKHYDGNPEATLEWLQSFNKEFTQKCSGGDGSYKFAQLLRSSARDAEKFDLDASNTTGWGVEPFGYDNGQYFTYILQKDGNVSVEKKNWNY